MNVTVFPMLWAALSVVQWPKICAVAIISADVAEVVSSPPPALMSPLTCAWRAESNATSGIAPFSFDRWNLALLRQGNRMVNSLVASVELVQEYARYQRKNHGYHRCNKNGGRANWLAHHSRVTGSLCGFLWGHRHDRVGDTHRARRGRGDLAELLLIRDDHRGDRVVAGLADDVPIDLS